MNDPRTILQAAKAAIDVCGLARKEAGEASWPWMQINKLAAVLVGELRRVQNNECLTPAIRMDARQDADSLAEVMRWSCEKAEKYRAEEIRKPIGGL